MDSYTITLGIIAASAGTGALAFYGNAMRLAIEEGVRIGKEAKNNE